MQACLAAPPLPVTVRRQPFACVWPLPCSCLASFAAAPVVTAVCAACPQAQGVTPPIVTRWLATEAYREQRDWEPLRRGPAGRAGGASSPTPQQHEPDEPDPAEADPHRVVSLEEIRDGIFPIDDPDLQEYLVLACLQLLGLPLAGGGGSGAGAGAGAAGVDAGSSCGTLRLLPPLAALAVCQSQMPAAGLAGAAAHGAAAGLAGAAVPWYAQSEARRRFASRLLHALLAGPYAEHPAICLAYLLAEAAEPCPAQHDPGDADAAAGPPPGCGPGPAWRPLARLDRAREAAKAVLARRRNSLAMWVALAALEGAAGQAKGARRILDAALASAGGLPEAARGLLPQLVLLYADLELGWARPLQQQQQGGFKEEWAGGAGPRQQQQQQPRGRRQEHEARAHHVMRWFLAGGCTGSNAYVPFKAAAQVRWGGT